MLKIAQNYPTYIYEDKDNVKKIKELLEKSSKL